MSQMEQDRQYIKMSPYDFFKIFTIKNTWLAHIIIILVWKPEFLFQF